MKIGMIGPGPHLTFRGFDAEQLAAEIQRNDESCRVFIDESAIEQVTPEEIAEIERGLARKVNPIPDNKTKGHQRPYKFHP